MFAHEHFSLFEYNIGRFDIYKLHDTKFNHIFSPQYSD